MATCITHSVEETLALGEVWGRAAVPGLIVAITGDLGAGKTQLVKGLARGLGIHERVQSPTFAIVNVYTSGRLPLTHMDLYRLETPAAIGSAGLDEYLRPAGIAAIEWAERWFGDLGNPSIPQLEPGVRFRIVSMTSLSETERQISYDDFGD